MKKLRRAWISGVLFLFLFAIPGIALPQVEIKLPKPSFSGKLSVEAAIISKKSARNYAGTALTPQEVSQILWSANGNLPSDAVSGATVKVIPSAGGLYPLEVLLVTGKDTVEGIAAGIYLYKPATNSLSQMAEGDNRTLLAHACLSQMWMSRAPALVVIAAVMERMTSKYGNRGYQYVFMEAGSSNQNVYLQAQSLGLKAATVGAFNDAQVCAVLKLPKEMAPLLIMTLGR